MIFKQQLADISTVLNNTGNTTKLLTSFNALDVAQQKVLLSSSLLTEKQKEQCLTMATLSAANTKYTAEQLAKATGISTETLATWGLIESTDSLTISELAEKAASDAQAKTVLDKIIAQNAEAVATGNVTASNTALVASEGGATLATGAFTTAIKANIKAMWTWMTTTPTGWLTMLAAGIFAVVKAYDALTVSVKEQKEKMEDSLSAYNDAKSELSNITTELENQEQAMDDLLAKEKLTYAEQGQLEELQAITKELRIQKDLAEKEEVRTQKKVAKDASDLFNKQFGKYDISENAIKEYQNNANINGNNLILKSDENDISSMIAAYIRFNDLLDEAYGSENQADIDNFKSLTEDLKDNIFDTAQELQEQQTNIADYYNTIKDIPYSDLTSEQKEIVDSYNAISNAIELIYKQLDPNTWKSMQIESVFDTEGIEKTKEELVEMVKAGEFDESTLQSYPKLSEALEQNKVSASELRNELEALAETESNVQDSTLNNETGISPLTISQTIDQLNTQLKPAFDSLNTAWNDIFTDDEFKLNSIDILSTCDSIKSKLDEMSELGLDVDYSAFENFVRVLNDSESDTYAVDKAFDSLANSIAQAALTGAEDFRTMKAALEDLGVVNSDIIAFQSLINNTTALEEAVTQAGLTMADFVVHTEDGSIAATDAARAFIEEMVGAENCSQALALLQLQQVLCNENSLDTTDDINACLALANAAGVAVEALSWLANVSAQYDAAVAAGDTVAQKNLSATMASIKAKINSEISNFQPVAVDFSGVGKNAKSAGSKAGKDYKDALKEQLSDLDSVISGITSRIDDQISVINEQKSAALESIDAQKEALEEAKEAAIEALEAERDAQLAIIEEQKKALEKQIKAKQDEIDKINDAAEARKREIDLQKAQYELERMQNQKTKLVNYMPDTIVI